MNDIVKAAIATPGPAIKEAQSRTDRETHKAIQDAVARYQLMFAGLTTTADPNDNDVKIITVDLPAISEVFKEIIDTTKVSEAVRMTQEQFTYHLAQRSTSKTFHDASMNYNAKALDAPKVTALKRAHWADRPLSIEPDSIKDKLGIYHFAPPRIESYKYEQRVANGSKIFRQEIVGEDRRAVKDGKQIDPLAYETAKGQARHIIATMDNMIPGMTLGPFVIKPAACGLFHTKDRAAKDKRQPDEKLNDDPAAARTLGHTKGRTGSGRRDYGRTPSRDNTRADTRSPNALSDLPAARITTLKAAGLVKYSGPGRVPHPVDILELNGSSGLTRICMMYITREQFCRYEDNCKQKHIKRITDFHTLQQN
jgi:hypothetical protein